MGRRVHLTAHLRLTGSELGDEGPCQRGDRPVLQVRNLRLEPLHRRVVVLVPVLQPTQGGLLIRQLLQGLRQLRAVLHRADKAEGVRRQCRGPCVGEQPLDRLPVAT